MHDEADPAASTGPARPTEDLPTELLGIRLRPPVVQAGSVPRRRLVDRLIGTADVPIVGIEAPAGYGKSTVLAQWANTDPRPFAWLVVDDRDNDARLLLGYIGEAIARVKRAPPDLRDALHTDRPSIWAGVVPRFVAAIASIREPFVLVLDEVEALSVGEAADVVIAISEGLQPGSQLVVAGRTLDAFAVARLVSQDRLALFRRDDLEMDEADARRLFAAADVAVTAADAEALTARCEGWPAGLALVAASIRTGGRTDGVAPSLVREYIRHEWLDGLPADDRTLLVSSSILERLNGSVCDAVVEREGSALRLAALQAQNQLLTEISGSGGWYRLHQLVRDELMAELERSDPERIALLHARSAAWFAANGDPEAALEHALAGRDIATINRLLPALTQQVFNAGRIDTFRRWYDRLESLGEDVIAPEVGYTAAAFFAQAGEASRADRWVVRAERATHGRRTSGTASARGDGPPSGVLELGRSLVGDLDPEARLATARVAAAEVTPFSPWQLPSLLVVAFADIAVGQDEDAARQLDAVIELWGTGAPPLLAYVMALGLRAAARLDAHDMEGAASDIALARNAIAVGQGDSLAVSAIIDAVEARLLVRRGAFAAARSRLAHAQPLRGLLTWPIPIPAVLVRLQLAYAYLALSDAAAAQTIAQEIRDIVRHRPRLGRLVDAVGDLDRRLVELHTSVISASSLTTAELRLLPLLSSHLTFKEIAQRLIVSQNTIKTQAVSIYRKLEATSRSEAIERAVAVGLLDRSALGFTPTG